jgi:hypothetical protein
MAFNVTEGSSKLFLGQFGRNKYTYLTYALAILLHIYNSLIT